MDLKDAYIRSVPKLLTAVADAMAWAQFSRGIRFLLHYLDDFLFLDPSGFQEASHIKELANVVFKELVCSSCHAQNRRVINPGYLSGLQSGHGCFPIETTTSKEN